MGPMNSAQDSQKKTLPVGNTLPKWRLKPLNQCLCVEFVASVLSCGTKEKCLVIKFEN